MKTSSVNGLNYQYQVKSNTGKKTGAIVGALAGTAYVLYDANQLKQITSKNIDKIKIKHPNINGSLTDTFKAFITKGEKGKGLYFCKNSTEIAKRTGILARAVVAGAMAGLLVGSIVDNINHAKDTKKALNKVG